MTFPSTACQTCKVRRIKCDETRPTCQRCQKSSRICIESRSNKQARFSMHDENQFASGKTKRPRGPRSSLTVLAPNVDLKTRAIAYYVKYHVQTTKGKPIVSGSLSECVSVWKASGKCCAMVDLAVSCMALAVFSRTQKHPPAAAEASLRYGHLLKVVQRRIAQVGNITFDERDIDSCLLAVSLMGRFESAMYSPGDTNSKYSSPSLRRWSHQDGAIALLKTWKDSPNPNAATPIIKQTRRRLIRSSVFRSLPLPGWILNGNLFDEQDLDHEYDLFFIQIVNLHHAFKSLQQEGELRVTKAEALNNEAQVLDKALRQWAIQLPSTSAYLQHVDTDSDCGPKEPVESSKFSDYSEPELDAIWGCYFAARMVINNTRLRILELSRSSPLFDFTYEQQRGECIALLQGMADKLACVMHSALERLNPNDSSSLVRHTSVSHNADEELKPYLAGLAIWPLKIASSLGGVNVKQQLLFRSGLSKLGSILGDAILEYAETNQWVVL